MLAAIAFAAILIVSAVGRRGSCIVVTRVPLSYNTQALKLEAGEANDLLTTQVATGVCGGAPLWQVPAVNVSGYEMPSPPARVKRGRGPVGNKNASKEGRWTAQEDAALKSAILSVGRAHGLSMTKGNLQKVVVKFHVLVPGSKKLPDWTKAANTVNGRFQRWKTEASLQYDAVFHEKVKKLSTVGYEPRGSNLIGSDDGEASIES
jgi:hypothetical protein